MVLEDRIRVTLCICLWGQEGREGRRPQGDTGGLLGAGNTGVFTY